jgi:hypothetical protein
MHRFKWRPVLWDISWPKESRLSIGAQNSGVWYMATDIAIFKQTTTAADVRQYYDSIRGSIRIRGGRRRWRPAGDSNE